MLSLLDQRFEAMVAKLTAQGAMFMAGEAEARIHKGPSAEGMALTLPAFVTAPPTLPIYFAYFCAQHADTVFLVDGDERLTFGQTYALAEKTARALAGGWGVKPGDHIGIAARNSASWIITYMGVLMAGGVATLLNGWWQGEELCAGITDTECTLVIADEPRTRRIGECGTSQCPVVTLDMSLPTEAALAPLLAREAAAALPMVTADSLATILFTSGSTGRSKGAYSTHRAVVQGTFNYLTVTVAMRDLLTEDGNPPLLQPSTLLNVPLFHVTAEVPIMLQSFAMGRKLVLMPKWDAREAMRLIEAEQITYFVGVPLMSYEIATHPDRDRFDLSSCAQYAAGGAPRPVEHVQRIRDALPHGEPLIGYGLTETNAVGTGNFSTNYLAKPNSAGRATTPIVDLAILDDAGRKVAQGVRGEVAIRSIANFTGYWNNPEATTEAFTDDGYFRTGDLGYLDAEDYLFIVDRKKDIIIRGGENISCQEVEDAIYQHPAVSEVAVFGLPDDRFGEIVGAVIVADQPLTLEALNLFLHDRLAAFKLPARVWQWDGALPRLGTEKIDKVALRIRFRAEHARAERERAEHERADHRHDDAPKPA